MADNKQTTTAPMGGIVVSTFTSRIAALKTKLSVANTIIKAADIVEMANIFNLWLTHTHTYQDTVITGTTEPHTTSGVTGVAVIPTNDIVTGATILAEHYNRIINGSNSGVKSHTHTLVDNNGTTIGSEESNATSPPSAATINTVNIGDIITPTALITILNYLASLSTHTHTYTDNYLDVIKDTINGTASAVPVFLNMNVSDYFTHEFKFGDISSSVFYAPPYTWNGGSLLSFSNSNRTVNIPSSGTTGLVCLNCNLSYYTARGVYLEFVVPGWSTSNSNGSGVGIAAVPYNKNNNATGEAYPRPRNLLMYNTAACTVTPTSPTTCIVNRQGTLTNMTLPEVTQTVGIAFLNGNAWVCFVTGSGARIWVTGEPITGTPTFTGLYAMKYPGYSGSAYGFTPMPCVYHTTGGSIIVRTPSENLPYAMPAILKPPIEGGLPVGIDVTFGPACIHGSSDFRNHALTLNHTGSLKVTHYGKIIGAAGKGGWSGELGGGDMIGGPGGTGLYIGTSSTIVFGVSTVIGGGGGGGDAGPDNIGGTESPMGGVGAGMWGGNTRQSSGLLNGGNGFTDYYTTQEGGNIPYTGGKGGNLGEYGNSVNSTSDGGGGAPGMAIVGASMGNITYGSAAIAGGIV